MLQYFLQLLHYIHVLPRFTEDDVDEMYREAPIKVIYRAGLKVLTSEKRGVVESGIIQ